MESIIVYASKYGATKAYAKSLSRATGISAESYSEKIDYGNFDTVIFMGGIYMGRLFGIENVLSQIPNASDKEFVIITIGIVDTEKEENRDNIKIKLMRELPDIVFEKSRFYHLRGAIDYRKLNVFDKLRVSFIYNQAKNKLKEEPKEDLQLIVDSYGKSLSFLDLSQIKKISNYL